MHRTVGVATIEKEYAKKVSAMKSLAESGGDISTREKALNLYISNGFSDPDVLSWLKDISDEIYNIFYQQNFKVLTEIDNNFVNNVKQKEEGIRKRRDMSPFVSREAYARTVRRKL